MGASVFPASGGGGFTGYPVQYVDPSGNNNATGGQGAPKKTISAAYNALADGGQILFAPNSKWSDGTEGLGLTDGQGVWLNTGLDVTGFLAQKNVTFQGYGTTSYGPFGTQASRMVAGKGDGSAARDNPGVWLVGCNVPITFKNTAIIADQPARLGWDYRRKSDLTVKTLPITDATRLDGQTTFTCTLTTSPIATMQRNAGTVRVTYTLDETYPVTNVGAVVRVDAGNKTSDFPNGDYAITATEALGGGVYYFEYLQGSGSVVETSPVGATLATTGVAVGALLYAVVEITSNTIQFPATMYLTQVQNSDATKITVRDPYGGTHSRTTNVSASNIGVLRLQIRYIGCTFETFDDCVMYAGTVGGEKFGLGPTIDKGDIAGGAEWSWQRRCYLQGSITGNALAEQEIARTSNLFMTGVNAVGIGVYGTNMSEGGIYQPIVNGNCYSTYDTVMQDTAISAPIFKTITLEAGNGSVRIVNASMADSQYLHPVAVDVGAAGGAVTVINSSYTGELGTIYSPPPVVIGGNDTSQAYWTQQTKSYDRMLANGFWGNDGRVAGKRDDVPSSFGVIQHPGYSNLSSTDISAWTTSGTISVTANQSTLGLDNTGKAFKLHCSAGGSAAVYYDATTPAAAAGDYIAIGYWIRASTDVVTGQSGLLSELTYAPGGANIPAMTQYVPFGNDGAWDWVVDIQALTASHVGQTTLRFQINVAQSHDVVIYMPQLLYFPAASYSPNECFRQLRVSRTAPPYLASGCAGTMPGIKLIGHGGLGVDSSLAKVVGVGSGQLTLTGSGTTYIPIYAADGTTIQGWVAQLQATVNP